VNTGERCYLCAVSPSPVFLEKRQTRRAPYQDGQTGEDEQDALSESAALLVVMGHRTREWVPHVVVESVCAGGAAEGVDFEERVGDRSCTSWVSRVGSHRRALEEDAEDSDVRAT
jgi:hypothetical protein